MCQTKSSVSADKDYRASGNDSKVEEKGEQVAVFLKAT